MMRMRFAAAVAGVAGGVLPAAAQFPANSPSPPTALAPFSGTGTVIGRPMLSPIGQAAPAAAPASGTPIGYRGPGNSPIDTGRPEGQVVDLNNLAAPLSAPLPPGLAPTKTKPIWEQVYDRWRAAIGLDRPRPTQSTWTPGISRRNRERFDATWRRD